MPNRDPHAVLGVERGASQETIKAAWRRLARMHHPDLTGDGPAAARRATRQMAEINTAYELLRDDPRGRRMGGSGAGGRQPRSQPAEANDPRAGRANGQGATAEARTSSSGARPGRQGPPRPKPSRPVTGRV